MYKSRLIAVISVFQIFICSQLVAQSFVDSTTIRIFDGGCINGPAGSVLFLMDPVPAADASKMFKLPPQLTNLCVFTKMMQRRQRQYAKYLEGELTDSVLIKELASADPRLFAGHDLKMAINLVTGLDSQMRRIFIIDNNNNNDFTDDKIRFVDTFKSSLEKFSIVENIEIFNPLKQKVEITRINVSPVIDEPRSYTIKNQSPSDCYQELRTRPEYRVGKITLSTGDSLQIEVSTTNLLNRFFDKSTTEIYPYLNGKLTLKKGFNRYYSIGDTLRINDSVYIIFVESPGDGSAIKFRYLTSKELPMGYQVNFQSIPIDAVDIMTNQPFRSRDYLRKKYILLDFWGTWCVPCKETTPGLLELHRNFGSKINFVSVAFDYDVEKVRDYIKTEHLNWIQLFENGGKVVPQSGITRNYEIGAYPTFILIDLHGEIVFRDVGTSGFHRLKEFIESSFSNNHYK